MADDMDKFHSDLNGAKNDAHSRGDSSGFGVPSPAERQRIEEAISSPRQEKIDQPSKAAWPMGYRG